MEIKFQDKLLKLIDKQSLDSFPRSLILEGKKGSGKHMLISYISEHLGINNLNITENLDLESINNYYLEVNPILYFIEADNISEKNQNTILKFLEEPLKNSYVILLTVNKYNLLQTIQNRCEVWTLANYSKENLIEFIGENPNKQLLLSIAETPGEIKSLKGLDISKEIEFCNKMIDKMNIAAFPNALTLSKHIAFNNEQDLIDISLFVRILRHAISDKIKQGNNYYKFYNLTNQLYKDLNIPNIDKKYLFDNYLTNMWYESRQGN